VRVYEAIVRGLESVGADTAFGGNGENIASQPIALEHSRKIWPIMTRHEQASFMACGYAMYTNQLGFCFATAGPGAFNLFSGRANALSDSYPYSSSPEGVILGVWKRWRSGFVMNDRGGQVRARACQFGDLDRGELAGEDG
jgi:acetolactate synthase-1/2/3 large subunit